MPYIAEHKEVIAAKAPDSKGYYNHLVGRWIYGTFKKAVDERNESLLEVIAKGSELYTGDADEALNYWYRTQYYSRIGDEAGALKAGMEEAAFLSAQTDDDLAREDEKGLVDAKAAIRTQLVMMQVPEEKLDELVQTNIGKNPSMRRQASVSTANKLNSIAWDIYEHHAKDAAAVQQAMTWSKRSLELTKGMSNWASFADTYAHLLYVSGNKAEAIRVQQEAVSKAKEQNGGDAASLEDSLKQMQEGKL
jgi:hypothetical protein